MLDVPLVGPIERALHLRSLGMFEGMPSREIALISQLMKEQRDHPSLPFWLITLSYGQHRSRAALRWCRETLNALRAMDGGAARRGFIR